jgi:hypothetical protein
MSPRHEGPWRWARKRRLQDRPVPRRLQRSAGERRNRKSRTGVAITRRQRSPNNLEAPGQPTKGRPSRQIAAAVVRERGAAADAPLRTTLAACSSALSQACHGARSGGVWCSPSSPCSRRSGRCAWLRAAPLLPSPPLRAASLCCHAGTSRRLNGTGKLPGLGGRVSSLLCARGDISNGENL